MILHARTHPTLDVPGCFPCRIAGVSFSSDATPTRRSDAAQINARERQWERDMPAYKRLRQDGVQPKRIDGAAYLEGADTRTEIEMGRRFDNQAKVELGVRVAEDLGMAVAR